MTGNFSAANVAAVTSHIAQALRNVRQAMANAGYADGDYTILVQNYPSPIPTSSGFRYSQSGYTRQSTGGCGFWNTDANWADGTALPTISSAVSNAVAQSGLSNVKQLDISSAFNGRRLCENTVGLLEEKGLSSWTQPGRRGQDRVGQPDPHGHHDRQQPVLHPGVAAPELLGPARPAQLRAPGVQQRRGAQR